MLKSVLRLYGGVLVWVLLGAAFFAWGLASPLSALIWCLWLLILGPLFLPMFLWRLAQWQGWVKPLHKGQYDAALQRQVLELALKEPGPNLRIWVRTSSDLGFFWFEAFWGSSFRQDLVIPSEWLRLEPAQRVQELRLLWRQIHRSTRRQRLLRSWQMAFWMSLFLPLEILLAFLLAFLELLGLENFPSPRFLLQRFCFALRRWWFAEDFSSFEPPQQNIEAKELRVPQAWESLLLGVWFQYPKRSLHPLWWLFSGPMALLDYESNPS